MSEEQAPSIYPTWGKTSRLGNLLMTITEKLDGTNALVEVREVVSLESLPRSSVAALPHEGKCFSIRAGSRTRWLTPGRDGVKGQDNFGFAKWVLENAQELVELGVGKHYGEWWGAGIGRRYDLTEKRFSIFNTFRPAETLPACVNQVPVLYKGAVDMSEIEFAKGKLETCGSLAAPGFMQPEGLVVCLNGERYKYVIDAGKGPKTREEAV